MDATVAFASRVVAYRQLRGRGKTIVKKKVISQKVKKKSPLGRHYTIKWGERQIPRVGKERKITTAGDDRQRR